MPWALEAVLSELAHEHVDAVVFGGDFLGGPAPRETLELVRSLDAICLCGNAERGLDGRDADLIGPAQAEWARSLPMTAELDGVLYCHATPGDDELMTTAITPDDELARLFAGFAGTVVIGHTHHQFDRQVGDLRVVNAGSVGMAYESRVAAFWLLVDDGEPQFRSTGLDVEELAARILASDWPKAEEFVAENVRVAVDRDEAIRHFESIR
jgi:predicted phosphodiesterase